MISVSGRLAVGRSLGAEDFLDLTPVPVTSVSFGPDGRLVVTFESDIEPGVARRVRRRIISSDLAEETLRQDIFVAAVTINQWEPITQPTVAKVLDRLEFLARQVRHLTRLTLVTDEEPTPPPAPPAPNPLP